MPPPLLHHFNFLTMIRIVVFNISGIIQKEIDFYRNLLNTPINGKTLIYIGQEEYFIIFFQQLLIFSSISQCSTNNFLDTTNGYKFFKHFCIQPLNRLGQSRILKKWKFPWLKCTLGSNSSSSLKIRKKQAEY